MIVNEAFVNKHVMPGDVVGHEVDMERETGPLRIGEGLMMKKREVVVTKAGLLRTLRAKRLYFVEHRSEKNYSPKVGDPIIGVSKRSTATFHLLDIGDQTDALLNKLSFDGATKRNKPQVSPGTIVYARVMSVDKCFMPEVSCQTPKGRKKKDWIYGESIYGELKGGYLFDCDLGCSLYLLKKKCEVLEILAEEIPFDIAVGINGKVWVNSKTPTNIVIVTQLIQKTYEFRLDSSEIKRMLSNVLKETEESI